MNKLYLECLSGISGDMFVAALLDLGADQKVLEQVLATVPAKGFQTKISRVKKAGLDVCDFDVILEQQYENHDHDMTYLFGTNQESDHHHMHTEQEKSDHHHTHIEQEKSDHHHTHIEQEMPDHHHAHNTGQEMLDHHHAHTDQEKSDHRHSHEHRGLQEVFAIIEQTSMTERARGIAKRIFTILGEAEAKAHGTTLEQVHFHEVGAIDSIVDIISAAVCFDNLQVEEVIVPVLCEGTGSIRCQHGVLPVPVPAVSYIIASHNLRLHITETKGELVTPTGAAILAAIHTMSQLPEQFTIEGIGMGAGKRAYENPSILRAMLIKEQEKYAKKDTIVKLESNIDDCTGENLGYVMGRLFEAGARDVNYMPIYMKKNRPAYQLNVICSEDDVERMEKIIFAETTTIGIRRVRMERTILERTIQEFDTNYGTVKVKVCEMEQHKRLYPEYENVVTIAKKYKEPFQEVYRKIERECYEQL
ncbi:nickel pincer cofactor biosynthesis protein LarC [Anaerosporobacter faecicola]|uniref:nickel pincer cofactor biosynthesis protein LarC n=1 Tax=Anaerosporobacter faecicola TaxID=2718714 RepID=UPI0014390C17|nr:nickel pincer cofactor biosynthesis protein LarC [Anaerosporobacter faecicola]